MAYQFVTNEAFYTTALPAGIASNETTLTMACWFYAPDVTGNNFLMSVADVSVGNRNHYLGALGAVAGDPVRAFSNDGTANGSADTSTSYSANTWHLAVGVWNGAASRTAYLDGGGKVTNTTSVSPTGLDTVGIGALYDNIPNYSPDIIIAEPAIWDIALSDAEVAELAVSVSPLMVRPDGLVFHPSLRRNITDDVGGLVLSIAGTPVVSEHPGNIIYPQYKNLWTPQSVVIGSPWYHHVHQQ